MKINWIAVMHVKFKQVKKVSALADKVKKGLTDNVALYATPLPTVGTTDTKNTILKDLIVKYDLDKSTQKRLAAENQSKIVFKALKDTAGYVSSVTTVKADILLSGFDADKDPVTHGIPENSSVIKRIDKGLAPLSAKIFLAKKSETDVITKYKVEVSSDDGVTYTTVLEIGNSRKLVVTGLVRLKEYLMRVTCGNTYGYASPSVPTPYVCAG